MSLADADVSSTSSLYLATPDESITAELVEAYFSSLWDELYIASAALDRVLPGPALQRLLLQKAVEATERVVKQARDVVSAGEIVREAVDEEELESTAESSGSGNAGTTTGTGNVTGALGGTGHDERTKRLLALRAVALHRLELLDTYVVLAEDSSWLGTAGQSPSSGVGPSRTAPKDPKADENANSDEDDEDDPWADDDVGGTIEPELQSADADSPNSPITPPPSPPPITLPTFLTSSLLTSALILTSALRFTAVSTVLTRHANTLFPRRFEILDAIPPFVHPQEYVALLPRVDWATGREILPASSAQSSEDKELDLVQSEEGVKVYGSMLEQSYNDFFGSSFIADVLIPRTPSTPLEPLPADEVTEWYTRRIAHVDGHAGLTDVALEIVQHGASLGVPGLDEVGEELSLLARLVYDSPSASTLSSSSSFPSSSSTSSTSSASTTGSTRNAVAITPSTPHYTLTQWRSLSPLAAIHAYLAQSIPHTLAADIRRLVNPYLFVLEARAERAGRPDEALAGRLIREYLLGSSDEVGNAVPVELDLCAAVFEASKPVAPLAQRIIKDDEELARVALARLYGASAIEVGADSTSNASGNAKAWATMSRIFECLPDWPSVSPTPSTSTSNPTEDEADATLASLATFIQPSTSRSTATPSELFSFFSPLPARSLSRALDVLDVHLECGEIMARWGVPVPLAWFLSSAADVREQRAWAIRMVRRTFSGSDHVDEGKKYADLLNDMIKLVGPSGEKARGAFRLLGRQEVTKVFFSGLLNAGSKFPHLFFMLPSYC